MFAKNVLAFQILGREERRCTFFRLLTHERIQSRSLDKSSPMNMIPSTFKSISHTSSFDRNINTERPLATGYHPRRRLSKIAWTPFAKSALAYKAWNHFPSSGTGDLFSRGLQVNPSRLIRIFDCSSDAVAEAA